MKYKEVTISEDILYFTQIKSIYPVPTDTFIDKTLPGIGITYGELTTERHKICTLPNLPPILGKGMKHPDCLTVYGNVTMEQVIDYLNNENFAIKKFICTPEAYYSKVKPAITQHEHFNLYEDFFFYMMNLIKSYPRLTTEEQLLFLWKTSFCLRIKRW